MKPFVRSPLKAAMAGLALAAAAGAALIGAQAAGPNEAGAGPVMVRKLTEDQYRRSIADIFGPGIKVVGRFEPDLRVEGLLAVGTSAVSVTPGGFEQYEAIARGIAGQVTGEAHRAELVGCAPGASDRNGAKCAASFIRRVGLRLYRRPLSAQEVNGLTSVTLAAARELGTFDAGLSATLAGMLASPDFLFRIDRAARSGETVDSWAKASRLSFLLWDTTPDKDLLDAAANGALDTPQGLSRQVDRMIASPRFSEGVRAFFTDMLQLGDIDNLSKDVLIFPAYSTSVAEAMREQTLRTITYLLVDQDRDYRDLFTARQIAMNRLLGPVYDIPVAKQGWYIHEFPAGDPRTGLLTHASLLALHAHPGRTSPTLRGKALREILLCEKVPSPPANVNFAVVQDVNNPTLKTTRARLLAHLDDESCSTCHKITDPLGLGLEQFDGVGQFRTRENGEPIDVTGTFEASGYDGAAQLGKLFAGSSQANSCLVRTAWKYAHGREPYGADASDLAALGETFAQQGHRMKALFRALALDPDFYSLAPGGAKPAATLAAGAMQKETTP